MSVTDRAALVTTNILNLLAMFRGAEFGFLREPIESLLRDEFADERRHVVADRQLPDP